MKTIYHVRDADRAAFITTDYEAMKVFVKGTGMCFNSIELVEPSDPLPIKNVPNGDI